MDFTNAALIFFALAVGIVILYSGIRSCRSFLLQRRTVDARERLIRETLDTAIVQRSQFQMDFDNKELQKYKVNGICVEVYDNWLQVDMNGGFASSAWAGEKVTVQFQISFKRKPSYFQFRSRIVDVLRKGKNFTMRLNLPQHMEPGQKRSTLRVTPQHERVLHMRLWLMSDTMPLPSFVAEMPPTDLEMRPEVSQILHLDNISAGGARLTITGEELERPLSSLNAVPNTRILFLVMLQTGEDTPPLALWIMGKINTVVDNEGKSLSLGIQFLQWATVQSSARPLSWLPTADENGVVPLAAWVMRHHLEQSKRI